MQKAEFIDVYRRFAGWLAERIGVTADFNEGFVAGIALVLVLLLLYVWVRHRREHPGGSKGITVSGEQGDLFITLNAVEEFVTRILYEFDEAALEGLTLRQRHEELVLNIDISAVPEADLVPLRDALQGRIIRESQERIGLPGPIRVNVAVRSLEADREKIARRSRKAGFEPGPGRGEQEPPSSTAPGRNESDENEGLSQ